MLRLEKLVKTYKTGDQALKAVDLEIPEGQHIFFEFGHIGGIDTTPVIADRNERKGPEKGIIIVVLRALHYQSCYPDIEVQTLTTGLNPVTSFNSRTNIF